MFKYLIIIFLLMGNIFTQQATSPYLIVEEEDGEPSVSVYKTKFSNGSVTDNGDGTVSVSAGGNTLGTNWSSSTNDLTTNVSTYFTRSSDGAIWRIVAGADNKYAGFYLSNDPSNPTISGNSDFGMLASEDLGQMTIFVDDRLDNAIILTNLVNRSKNHDVSLSTNPILYGFSDTDPDTDNTQYWSIEHDKTDVKITAGKGNIDIVADNLTLNGSAIGGGGSGEALEKEITQSTHGFSVGDVIFNNGSIWQLADADSENTSDVMGIVSVVTDVNTFTINMGGYIEGLTLTAGSNGDFLFLSGTAGALTATAPDLSKPVLLRLTSSTGIVQVQRGAIAKSVKSIKEISVQSAKLTGSDITTSASIDAGNRGWMVLFDDSTSWEVVFQFVVNGYNESSFDIDFVFCMETTQSGATNVKFDAKIMAVTEDDALDFDTDGYDSVQSVTKALATDQVAGYVKIATISFTQAQADDLQDGDIVRLHISRDVAVASDATGDIQLLGVNIHE